MKRRRVILMVIIIVLIMDFFVAIVLHYRYRSRATGKEIQKSYNKPPK